MAEKEKFNHSSVYDFSTKTHTLVITDKVDCTKNDNFNVMNINIKNKE